MSTRRPWKLVAVATVGREPLRRRVPLFDGASRNQAPMLRGWHKRQRGPAQKTEALR